MKRYASVIDLKPKTILAYKQLHAHTWQGVLDTIRACNIRNYSIYLRGNTLYAYFEYVGNDYAADMAKVAADPITQAWWSLCKPMQVPTHDVKPGEHWHDIDEVFHTD